MSRVIINDLRQTTVCQRWTIHHLTDIHDGSRHHAEAAFDKRVAEIAADPFARWIGGGDYGELILPNDPRFAAGEAHAAYLNNMNRIPDVLLERMTDRLMPIADKCLFFGIGNHETAIAKHYSRGIGEELALRLGIADKFGGYRGYAPLRFHYHTRVQTVRAFTYHGWSAGRSKSRKFLEAEREIGARAADLYFLGHDHQPFEHIFQTERLNERYEVEMWTRVFVNGGCWLEPDKANKRSLEVASQSTDPSWVSKFNFPPERVGGPIVHIDVDMGGNSRPASVAYVIESRSHG